MSTHENNDALEGLGELTGEVEETKPPAKKKRAPRKKAAAKAEERVTIVIDEEQGKPNFEVVGVNGKVYQIQRGVEVAVPVEVVTVLENAIASRLIEVKLPDGRVDRQLRDYQAIPFRVVR